mmetsp:Transcript_45327/g.71079  ORF Transcript_45327/g.71079 Transcript_45327/m.71079 type:complete len:108 (+) Transcript_45327:584-907(+)
MTTEQTVPSAIFNLLLDLCAFTSGPLSIWRLSSHSHHLLFDRDGRGLGLLERTGITYNGTISDFTNSVDRSDDSRLVVASYLQSDNAFFSFCCRHSGQQTACGLGIE